jgi:hypothetical protein
MRAGCPRSWVWKRKRGGNGTTEQSVKATATPGDTHGVSHVIAGNGLAIGSCVQPGPGTTHPAPQASPHSGQQGQPRQHSKHLAHLDDTQDSVSSALESLFLRAIKLSLHRDRPRAASENVDFYSGQLGAVNFSARQRRSGTCADHRRALWHVVS